MKKERVIAVYSIYCDNPFFIVLHPPKYSEPHLLCIECYLSIALCDFLKGPGSVYIFFIDSFGGLSTVHGTKSTAFTMSPTLKRCFDILFSLLAGGGFNFRWSHRHVTSLSLLCFILASFYSTSTNSYSRLP